MADAPGLPIMPDDFTQTAIDKAMPQAAPVKPKDDQIVALLQSILQELRKGQPAATSSPQWQPNENDLRPDGTRKGTGFLGPLPIKNAEGKAGVASEYSAQSDAMKIGGQRVDFPTLVPGLTKDELDSMTGDIIPNKKPVPEPIMQKAIGHAQQRIAEGKSVFAEPNESAPKPQPVPVPPAPPPGVMGGNDSSRVLQDIALELKTHTRLLARIAEKGNAVVS